jgi:uncharacterized protein (TIRG00374 family)
VFLVVSGVLLYLLFPSIVEVFEAWDRLGEVHPAWLAVIVVFEALSFLCMWLLQRIALRTREWYSVITTQLAGNAFNRITPGGGATGTALQARMLSDAGFDLAAAGTALTVQSIMVTAAVVAMPVLSLPAVIAGTDVPGRLRDAVFVGAGVFVLMCALGAVLLGTRRPVAWLGDAIERVANPFRRHSPKIVGLGARMLRERDLIRMTMGSKWLAAVGAAVGRWGFEYLALLATLYAIDARPDPWLVLLAFVASSVLGLLPFTPGGLGFVEAGMTATLAVAGITPEAAVLATLVFRLVSFWLPLPVGLAAAFAFRRRHPRPIATTARGAAAGS